MLCSKIGSSCPHPVSREDNFVFVMMPFKGFDNVYFTIQTTVQEIKNINGKNFICHRADEKYTTFAIWCKNICANIRKAKYLIVDTTGKNANVFYELGFSHALETTTAILITQNIADAPFDISDINHIQYTADNPRQLRENLKKAVESLEKEEEKKSFKNKTADEMIIELKSQLLKEEERATKFKNELYESEDRERKLKERIKEIDAINKNPIEEAKNQITSLEGVVAELKSRLKFTEQNDREEILQLKQLLKDKEAKLEILDREFESYKHSKNDKPLTTLLIDNSKIKSEAERWFYRGLYEVNIEKKVIYYSEAIDLNHDDANFYRNRGHAYKKLKEYTKALNDFNKAIELNPNDKVAYNTRGTVYFRIKDYEKAAADYSNALKLDPDYIISYGNLAELYVVKGDYENALQVIYNSLSRSPKIENLAIIIYLECIARKMLDLDISESEKKFAAILKKDFKTTWSFDNFELWLSTANIDDDKKAFIIEKTECLKEHTDIMDKN